MSSINKVSEGMALVRSMIYEPGNGSRYEITATRTRGRWVVAVPEWRIAIEVPLTDVDVSGYYLQEKAGLSKHGAALGETDARAMAEGIVTMLSAPSRPPTPSRAICSETRRYVRDCYHCAMLGRT